MPRGGSKSISGLPVYLSSLLKKRVAPVFEREGSARNWVNSTSHPILLGAIAPSRSPFISTILGSFLSTETAGSSWRACACDYSRANACIVCRKKNERRAKMVEKPAEVASRAGKAPVPLPAFLSSLHGSHTCGSRHRTSTWMRFTKAGQPSMFFAACLCRTRNREACVRLACLLGCLLGFGLGRGEELR